MARKTDKPEFCDKDKHVWEASYECELMFPGPANNPDNRPRKYKFRECTKCRALAGAWGEEVEVPKKTRRRRKSKKKGDE